MEDRDFLWHFFVKTGNPEAYLMYKGNGIDYLPSVVPEED